MKELLEYFCGQITWVFLWPDCLSISVVKLLEGLLWPKLLGYFCADRLLEYFSGQTAWGLLWPNYLGISVAKLDEYFSGQTAWVLLWPNYFGISVSETAPSTSVAKLLEDFRRAKLINVTYILRCICSDLKVFSPVVE